MDTGMERKDFDQDEYGQPVLDTIIPKKVKLFKDGPPRFSKEDEIDKLICNINADTTEKEREIKPKPRRLKSGDRDSVLDPDIVRVAKIESNAKVTIARMKYEWFGNLIVGILTGSLFGIIVGLMVLKVMDAPSNTKPQPVKTENVKGAYR